MTVNQFCEKNGLTEGQFYGREPVEGDLWLDGLTSLPPGFAPAVGGNLRLNGLTSLPPGFASVVDGNLWLDGLTSLPPGFAPVVGGGLGLNGLTSLPPDFALVVGGSLWLDGLTSLPPGFAPVVSGSLGLNRLTSLPPDFAPVVGGNLWLDRLTSLPPGFAPVVGGNLGLPSLPPGSLIPSTLQPVFPHVTRDGNYVLADGVLQHLVSKKGLVYRVRELTEERVTYLVTDGRGKCAHGDTLSEARESLVYKIGNRDKSQYQGLTPESVLTYPEAIEAYRVVTGACEAGVRGFVAAVLGGKTKGSYSIAEILALTNGQYGSREFGEFFGI